jgi:hypothetical protein
MRGKEFRLLITRFSAGNSGAEQTAEKLVFAQFCVRARLYRLLKNSICDRLVSGHDFSRADKPLIFGPPRGL